MTKIKFAHLIIFSSLIFLVACQSVSKKIDEKTTQEEKELSKWLNKTESDLKIVYGQPDEIEFLKTKYIDIKNPAAFARTYGINTKVN